MSDEQLIQKTADYVKEKFVGEASGHDWWHIARVWQLAKTIGVEEKADMLVVELAALLHDIADWKFNDEEDAGPKAARHWLESIDTPEEVIAAVEHIVRHISFKGANVKSELASLEGYVVHDADKLDAIGAIGIARAFAYGGSAGRIMYDPLRKPVLHQTFEDYKKDKSGTINHFYDKLLLLKDRMFTKTGKKMAVHRHEFMEKYLEEFYAEWSGDK
jgi:uncharacterized protein